MKRIMFLSLFVVSLFFIGTTGCKEDFKFEGTLEINSSTAINNIWVYSLEDKTNPVYDLSYDGDKHISLSLNVGNYQLNGYTSDGYLGTVTFQIRPDQTLKIEYDSDNVGKIIN